MSSTTVKPTRAALIAELYATACVGKNILDDKVYALLEKTIAYLLSEHDPVTDSEGNPIPSPSDSKLTKALNDLESLRKTLDLFKAELNATRRESFLRQAQIDLMFIPPATSVDAEEALEEMNKAYSYPVNPANCARYGWEAARKLVLDRLIKRDILVADGVVPLGERLQWFHWDSKTVGSIVVCAKNVDLARSTALSLLPEKDLAREELEEALRAEPKLIGDKTLAIAHFIQ